MLVKRFQNHVGIPLGEVKEVPKEVKSEEKKEVPSYTLALDRHIYDFDWHFQNSSEQWYLCISASDFYCGETHYVGETYYRINNPSYDIFTLEDESCAIISKFYLPLIEKTYSFEHLLKFTWVTPYCKSVIYNAYYIQGKLKAKIYEDKKKEEGIEVTHITQLIQALKLDIENDLGSNNLVPSKLKSLNQLQEIQTLENYFRINIEPTVIIEILKNYKWTAGKNEQQQSLARHIFNFIHVLNTYNGYCFAPFQETDNFKEKVAELGIETDPFEIINNLITIETKGTEVNYTEFSFSTGDINGITGIILNSPKILYNTYAVPETNYEPITDIFANVLNSITSVEDFKTNYVPKMQDDLNTYFNSLVSHISNIIKGNSLLTNTVISFDRYELAKFDQMMRRFNKSEYDVICENMIYGPLGFLAFAISGYKNLLIAVENKYNVILVDEVSSLRKMKREMRKIWESIYSSEGLSYDVTYEGTEQEKRVKCWNDLGNYLEEVVKSNSIILDPGDEIVINSVEKLKDADTSIDYWLYVNMIDKIMLVCNRFYNANYSGTESNGKGEIPSFLTEETAENCITYEIRIEENDKISFWELNNETNEPETKVGIIFKDVKYVLTDTDINTEVETTSTQYMEYIVSIVNEIKDDTSNEEDKMFLDAVIKCIFYNVFYVQPQLTQLEENENAVFWLTNDIAHIPECIRNDLDSSNLYTISQQDWISDFSELHERIEIDKLKIETFLLKIVQNVINEDLKEWFPIVLRFIRDENKVYYIAPFQDTLTYTEYSKEVTEPSSECINKYITIYNESNIGVTYDQFKDFTGSVTEISFSDIVYPITSISNFEPNTEEACYAVIELNSVAYISDTKPNTDSNPLVGTIASQNETTNGITIKDGDGIETEIVKYYYMYNKPKSVSEDNYTRYDISVIMTAFKSLVNRIGNDEKRCLFKCIFGSQLQIDQINRNEMGRLFGLTEDLNFFNSTLHINYDWYSCGFNQLTWIKDSTITNSGVEDYGSFVSELKTYKVSNGDIASYNPTTIKTRLVDFLEGIKSCLYTELNSKERQTALVAYKMFSFVRTYDHFYGCLFAPTQDEYMLEDILSNTNKKYIKCINDEYEITVNLGDGSEKFDASISELITNIKLNESSRIYRTKENKTYITTIPNFSSKINLQTLFSLNTSEEILTRLSTFENSWKTYLDELVITLKIFTKDIDRLTCDSLKDLYDTLWFGEESSSGDIAYGLFAFYVQVQIQLKQWCIDNEVDYNEFEDWLDLEGNLSDENQQVIKDFSLIYSVNEDEGTYSCYPNVEDFTQAGWEQRSAQWRRWLVSLMGFRSLLNYKNKASDNDYILDDFTIVQNSNYGGYKINLQTNQNLPMVDERYFFNEEFPIYNEFIFLTYDYLDIMWALYKPKHLLSPELLKCIYYNNYQYAKSIKEPDDFIYRFFWLEKDFFIPKEILGITDPFNLYDQQGVLIEAYPENEKKPNDIGFYKQDEVNGWFTVSGDWKKYGEEIVKLINKHSTVYELVKESLHFIRTFNDQYEIRFMGRTGLGYEKLKNNNYWLPVIHGRTRKEITEFKCLVEKTEDAGNNNDYFISVENKPDTKFFPYEYYFCPVYLDNGEFIYYYPQFTLTDLTIEFNEEMALPDFKDIKINELSEEDKERARTEYIEGINTITTAIKSKLELIKGELTKLIQATEVTTNLQKCYVYSVDAYPHEEIDKILTNIFGKEFKTRKWEETTDLIVPEGKCGILELEEYIYQYLNIYQTELFKLFNVTKLEDIPTGGRIKDGKFVYNAEKFSTFYEKKKAIYIYEEREDGLGETYIVDTYYEGHSGVIQGETQERNKCWGPFTEVIQSKNIEEYTVYGTGFNGQFEAFSDYISTLTTAEEPDIPDNNTTIETIEEAELEIYDKQEIYNVFESSLKDGTIDVIEELTTTLGMTVEEFIRTLIDPDGEIKTFCAYREPEVTEPISADDNDKLIEYSQMFQTIQMEKDALKGEIDDNWEHGYIQYLLAFLQTPKGTIFTLVTSNLTVTNKPTDANEIIDGFYLCKGIEKGRYRIVGMTKLYEGEPLDWCNDNYYSNFIYDQNMENLNVIIDGEFSSRTTPCNGKEIDQNMVGYYILESKF